MNVLDLFSGIGGFSLGFERVGLRTLAFCESEEYCRAVLRKHWPEVPCFADVAELTGTTLRDAGIEPIDIICGGFPCQDISRAGLGAGIAGARSGLWHHFARIIREVGPRYVVIENVAALTFRGIETVLRDLAALGYDAEWHCIPASYVRAPHRRDRVWIIAHADAQREHGRAVFHDEGSSAPLFLCDPVIPGPQGGAAVVGPPGRLEFNRANWWDVEPELGRMADGIPNRIHRIKALGNSIVPQIAELIGRSIIEFEGKHYGR